MTDHTICQVCSAPRVQNLGLYCRPCYNRAAYIRKHGSDEGYTPRVMFSEGMPCSICSKPITSETRFDRYTLCKTCGQAKATDKLRRWRKSKQPQRRPPSNPIIVAPKTHRAKGQEMAPPAPRVDVKPERVVVPEHIVVTRVPCAFGRFEDGRRTIWDERIEG